MKDNVLDLLIYLFENYLHADDEPRPDRATLKQELDKAGFAEPDIERALEWLDGLSGEQLGQVAQATARAVRVFNSQENLRLDTDVRGYLMYLENVAILSMAQREVVIDRLMALEVARHRATRSVTVLALWSVLHTSRLGVTPTMEMGTKSFCAS